MDNKIKMDTFLKTGARILSDRDEGVKARGKANLDELDSQEKKVVMLIPKDDMWNITPSFFGGMFEGIIKKYREKFWDYYSFTFKNGDPITERIRNKLEYNYNYILERLD